MHKPTDSFWPNQRARSGPNHSLVTVSPLRVMCKNHCMAIETNTHPPKCRNGLMFDIFRKVMVLCRKCGKEVQEDWITCPYCSTTIGSLPDSNLQKTPATNVQKSIVKVDTPSVVVQDSIVKVEGANNASYHNPTIQSEQNIDYVESSKYSPNIWAFIFIGVIISVIGDDGIFSGGCVFGFPIILFAVAYKLHFTSRHKYRCGACDKVNYISTAVGLVQMTTSGHQSITSINPAVGVTTSGKLGVGGITTTSQIPIHR